MSDAMKQIKVTKLTLNIGAGKEQSVLERGVVLLKQVEDAAFQVGSFVPGRQHDADGRLDRPARDRTRPKTGAQGDQQGIKEIRVNDEQQGQPKRPDGRGDATHLSSSPWRLCA